MRLKANTIVRKRNMSDFEESMVFLKKQDKETQQLMEQYVVK